MSTLLPSAPWRKPLRALAWTVGVLALLLVLALTTSPYLRRWASLRQVDFYDYDKLPSRPIARSDTPSPLPSITEGDWLAPLGFTYQGQPIRDEAALGSFLAEHATTAFIVIKDGKILDERYFNGFRRESLCKSFSVSKSVLSALIGIAVADDLIASIDDPVAKYLPEMKDPRFARVTLRHCLDLTAGVHYTRGPMPWKLQPRMYYTTDMRDFVHGTKLQWEPGTSFVTEDLSPQILGCVLEKALQCRGDAPTISAYFAEKLWKPMGAEFDALWNLDREQNGIEKTESGLTARPIDLAKFALLYLHEGRCGSRSLVPAEWVTESTTIAPGTTAANVWKDGFHKHLWWGSRTAASPRPDFYANGHFGQRFYVSPSQNLVLVRMGYDNSGVDWAHFLGAIVEAFSSKGGAT
jgi:CubicO group peptidase (beta-lactamase class C family)